VSLPTASFADAMGFAADVVFPTIAKGVIIRRPHVVSMAERFQLDRRAVHRMQRLRDRYAPGPVLLRMPGRTQAIVLAPADVRRVLQMTPEPFATASSEKVSALSHFQPNAVLISTGTERAERRRINEEALDSGQRVHRLAEAFTVVVQEENEHLLNDARRARVLSWEPFIIAWFRMVRRIVLGDAARDAVEVTQLLSKLRGDANWAFMKPKREGLRREFDERLRHHARRAESGSLAHAVATMSTSRDADPIGQMPHWLFAFDAGAIATFRALALLLAHRPHLDRARAEAARGDAYRVPELPFLRAAILESVRLWPTTPVILRQTTTATTWNGSEMPAGTGVLVYVPFFHRDTARVPFADRFAPDVWLGGTAPHDVPLVPFSDGPASCPGRELVLLVGSLTLATLLRGARLQLESSVVRADQPMPGTLDPFTLRFAVQRI
jgi:cytochrome P450